MSTATKMTRRIRAALVAILAALSVVAVATGCDYEQEPSSQNLKAVVSESVYLDYLETHGVSADRGYALRVAHQVCDMLDNNLEVASVLSVVHIASPQQSLNQSATMTGAAIGSFCPEYTPTSPLEK